MDLSGIWIPIEIVEQILSNSIPDHWNSASNNWGKGSLELRLVCRLIEGIFNGLVSRQALRKVDHDGLRQCAAAVSPVILVWLLATKIRYRFDAQEGLAAHIWKLANEMWSWKQRNSKPASRPLLRPGPEKSEGTAPESCSTEQYDYDYITEACNVLVAVKGRLWVLEQLRGSSKPDQFLGTHKGQQGLDAIAYLGGLQVAICCGDDSITEALLKPYVDPNSQHRVDSERQCTVNLRHPHGVDPKCQYGVDPNCLKNFGHPLFFAVRNGDEEMVKLLVEAGAPLDGEEEKPFGYYHSAKEHSYWPVAVARHHGHVHIELYLLKRCIHLDSPVVLANWALLYASRQGMAWAVQLALQRPDIDVNTVTRHGNNTPLILATIYNHEQVIEMLLKRRDIQVNTRDSDNFTALQIASFLRLSNMAKLLLSRPDVDPNIRDHHGEAPLSRAVMNSDHETVRYLLQRRDLDLGFQDGVFNPLEYAIFNRDYNIATLLLERADVRLDTLSFGGYWMLPHAVYIGNDLMVGLLLKRDDVNPNFGPATPPLIEAVSNSDFRIVHLLLTRSDLDPNVINHDPRISLAVTALALACWKGLKDMVTLLLQDARILPDRSVSPHLSPLWCAAAAGHNEIVQLLLDDGRVSPEALFRHLNIDRELIHPHNGITASNIVERMRLHRIATEHET
ncbi:ankyrin repeat-containing domain protein [Xylariaceae sp. FL1272]|nr:ankyrin repeat-containing domain protein [Xylariaceae sp. FL1272]